MSTETTNKKIKIDNGTTFGRTYTDKAIDERLQGLVSTATFTPVQEKANNSLQKPTGLTKTELVGVGANGQENIEIGDNLTLANGKLSATGGGSGGNAFDTIVLSDDGTTYTGTITGERPFLIESSSAAILPVQNYLPDFAFAFAYEYGDDNILYLSMYRLGGGQVQCSKVPIAAKYYSHFITMTNSSDNVAIYLVIQNTSNTEFTAETLATYFSGKKVLANGNLHGVAPTHIAGEGGVIKIYYRTPGDSNINPTPDEYQDLSSFTITDLVSPVE